MKNYHRKKSREQAQVMNVIFQQLSFLDMAYLQEVYKEMKNELNRYMAIGIMNGTKYLDEVKDKKARLWRLEALIKLIEVFKETQGEIKNDN